MARPNALLTRVRRWLSRKLDVGPDAGEAWCINCKLTPRNRTLVLSADAMSGHLNYHREQDPHGAVFVTGTFAPAHDV